jgi:hypothetical protein
MDPRKVREQALKIIQINGWLGRLNGLLARFIEK